MFGTLFGMFDTFGTFGTFLNLGNNVPSQHSFVLTADNLFWAPGLYHQEGLRRQAVALSCMLLACALLLGVAKGFLPTLAKTPGLPVFSFQQGWS